MVCRFFAAGYCARGSGCFYVHADYGCSTPVAKEIVHPSASAQPPFTGGEEAMEAPQRESNQLCGRNQNFLRLSLNGPGTANAAAESDSVVNLGTWASHIRDKRLAADAAAVAAMEAAAASSAAQSTLTKLARAKSVGIGPSGTAMEAGPAAASPPPPPPPPEPPLKAGVKSATLRTSNEQKKRWSSKWWQLVIEREREACERSFMGLHDEFLSSQLTVLDTVFPRGAVASLNCDGSDCSDDELNSASGRASWHSFLSPATAERTVMGVGRVRVANEDQPPVDEAKAIPTASLFKHIITGDIQGLQKLLSTGSLDWNGRLSEIDYNEASLLDFFATNKLSNHAVDGEGRKVSPFTGNSVHLAAALGDGAVLGALLTRAPLAVDSKDRHSQTPLHFAARGGHLFCVRVLLDFGADVDAKDKYAETVLHAAARGSAVGLPGSDRPSVCRFLSTRVRQSNPRNKARRTPLHLACYRNDVKVVSALLTGPILIDTCDVAGHTPLSEAAMRGFGPIVDLLIHRNACAFGEERSMGAAEMSITRSYEKLRTHGSRAGTPLMRSAFHEAAAHGNLAVLSLLVQHFQGVPSFDIEGKNPSASGNRGGLAGDTALILAVRGGFRNMVEFLLVHGASPVGTFNSAGHSALAVAASMQDPLVFDVLLDYMDGSEKGDFSSYERRQRFSHWFSQWNRPGKRSSTHGINPLEHALARGRNGAAAELLLRGAPITGQALRLAGLLSETTTLSREIIPVSGTTKGLAMDWAHVLHNLSENDGLVGRGEVGDEVPSIDTCFADVQILFWSDCESRVERVMHAHSCVLKARSEYFRASLDHGYHSDGKVMSLHMHPHQGDPNFTSMRLVREFLYTGNCGTGFTSEEIDIVEVLVAANRLLLGRLQRQCEHVIGRRLSLGFLLVAIHLCDLVDVSGEEPSDLYWYVQNFVHTHREFICVGPGRSKGADCRVRLPQGFVLRELNEVLPRVDELAASAFIDGEIWDPEQAEDLVVPVGGASPTASPARETVAVRALRLCWKWKGLSFDDTGWTQRLRASGKPKYVLEDETLRLFSALGGWGGISSAVEDSKNTYFTPGEKNIVHARFCALARGHSESGQALCRSLPNVRLVGESWRRYFTGNETTGGNWDVLLVTDDGSEVGAHRAVLAARCESFRARFRFLAQCGRLENVEGGKHGSAHEKACEKVIVPGISRAALGVMLHFIYTGSIPDAVKLPAEEPDDAAAASALLGAGFVLAEVCFAGEEHLLPQLTGLAARALLENHLTPDTAPEALRLAHALGLDDLRIASARFVLEHLSLILAAAPDEESGTGATDLGSEGDAVAENLPPRELVVMALSSGRRGPL